MALKILKLTVLIFTALGAIIFISAASRRLSDTGENLSHFERSPEGGEPKISTSTVSLGTLPKASTTPEGAIKVITQKPILKDSELVALSPVINKITDETKEVSGKSFEELINSSVIQLYCGNLNADESVFSDISRGTGIIIDSSGKVLTNRHVIYDENSKKVKNNCFILKSPFPNTKSLKPKIYYSSQVISYPLVEKFSDIFSKDKYYNDFALLKIISVIDKNSKINLLLGFDYAAPEDYLITQNNGVFNFLPIDWDYQPKNDDFLITLGYGIDSSHVANKITSTIGKIAGNINIDKSAEPQILLIESNATTGFSGGALINPKSKGLVGLVSWITTGDATGKYTAVIFRDFLRSMMIQHLNFDLKLL